MLVVGLLFYGYSMQARGDLRLMRRNRRAGYCRIEVVVFDVGDTLVDEWEPVDDIIGQFVREACAYGYPVKIEAVRELFASCYRNYEQW